MLLPLTSAPPSKAASQGRALKSNVLKSNVAYRMASKKRKPEAIDSFALEAERSLHQSFVHAANAVSQLYTSSLTGNKRAHVDGARQVLVSLSPARLAKRAAAAWTSGDTSRCQRGRP